MRNIQFISTVKRYFKSHKRPMPWRETTDPYKILISEVMLQQTQVDRVIPKFKAFLQAFPTVNALAQAEFEQVLGHWNGLGYNRRALWLHQAAKEIVEKYKGSVPESVHQLTSLKGIGPNTAAAICVYAFNKPEVFIETNIRAVYIHHFFPDRDDVDDKELVPLIEANMDTSHPREWYWALMDYGVHLKKLHTNPARKSKHHAKQSKFEGSNRQLRGQILKLLLQGNSVSIVYLADSLAVDMEKVQNQLANLKNEGLILMDQSIVRLP